MEPTLLIGAAIVAVLAGGIISSASEDDDESASPPPEPTPVDPDEGTDGSDLITDYDPTEDPDGVLSTLNGEDTVRFAEDVEVTWDIGAGPGDDRIDIGHTSSNRIHGGSGDDEINLDHGADARVHGGWGDDTISVSDDTYSDAGNLSVFGDRGDDVIEVNRLDGVTQLDDETADGPRLSGGRGSDSFELSIELNERMIEQATSSGDNTPSSGENPSDDGPRTNNIGRITDFVSGEDTITIDPVSDAGTATYLGHEIIQSADQKSTGITLYYGIDGQSEPVLHSTIWLMDTPSITESDLNFVNLPAGTA